MNSYQGMEFGIGPQHAKEDAVHGAQEVVVQVTVLNGDVN